MVKFIHSMYMCIYICRPLPQSGKNRRRAALIPPRNAESEKHQMAEHVESFIIQVVKKDNDQTRTLKTEALLRSLLERGKLMEVVSISQTHKKNENKAG